MKPDGVWSHAWGNGGRWLVIAAGVFMFAIGILVMLAIGALIDTTTDAYNPLSFPGGDQRVVTAVVKNGAPITVTGKRCSNADHPILVTGGYSWVSYTPGGYKSDAFSGSSTRKPGCELIHFVNPMPQTIVEINKKFFAQGATQVQWRLEGSTTPIEPGTKTPGVPATWKTTVFTVVP